MLIWLFSVILIITDIFNLPQTSLFLVSGWLQLPEFLCSCHPTLEPSLCFCLNRFNRTLSATWRHFPKAPMSPKIKPFRVEQLWKHQHQLCLIQPTSLVFTTKCQPTETQLDTWSIISLLKQLSVQYLFFQGLLTHLTLPIFPLRGSRLPQGSGCLPSSSIFFPPLQSYNLSTKQHPASLKSFASLQDPPLFATAVAKLVPCMFN